MFFESNISSIRIITESAIGTIIMVVAVLEIHIDRNAVAIIKPNKILPGFTPNHFKTLRAMRLCKFHRCMARATKNPPIKRKMI